MKSHSETVTVLTAVYNGAPFLEAAIESVRHQTYTDFEFIIVDDGSTDSSFALAQKIAARDSRIRLIPSVHEGPAAARNRGLALAKGTIVVCMDADDVAMPGRIECQLGYLVAHPEVVVVGSALQLIDKDGQQIAESSGYPLTPQEIRKGLLTGCNTIGHPTVAMRREAVLSVGGYRRLFDFAEDFDLWLRLSERHALANLPDVLVNYRWHGGNATILRKRAQALAAHIAKLAAQERSLGRPDPTNGLDRLCVDDLERFYLPLEERAAILQELSEAALFAYEATGEARHAADVEESLYAEGHPRGERAKALAARFARLLWNAGEARRSIAAVGWKWRAEMRGITWLGSSLLDMRQSRRSVGDWLLHCADPLRRRTPPDRMLTPYEARELVRQADKHGVLPAVLRNFPPFEEDGAFAGAKADALARQRSQLTLSLMLRAHGEAVMASAGGLPVLMVKGPVFSRTIYPEAGLRNFTDIDLLIATEAGPPLARVLEQRGFRLVEDDSAHNRQEWKWLHCENDALMIEIHTNLVHHPQLRQSMSIRYEDLANIAETPAALLTVAVVHGAMERYELLRHVVDVCQAARRVDSVEEECRFEAIVKRTGAQLAAVAGLDLGYRLFKEPRCRELARRLGPVRHAGLARLLLGRSAITSTMSDKRFLHSWRRQGFRLLLKRRRAL
jgi:glycosyl transferase family 2/putative nucleotidyltransferase-like protein